METPHVLLDSALEKVLDRRKAVARMERGFRLEAEGKVALFPHVRNDGRGVTMVWLGAAIPEENVVGFRAFLYDSKGYDLGHQVVGLYAHASMELRGIILGSRLGVVRTGATVAAALHLAEPKMQRLAIIGTGAQAHEALACSHAVLALRRVVVYSPNRGHRDGFVKWVQGEFGLDAEAADSARDAVRAGEATILATSATTPVLGEETLTVPTLLVSISAYRRPEIDPRVYDSLNTVWSDSVDETCSPGTLFSTPDRRRKVRPVWEGVSDRTLRDRRRVRIVFNSGAGWQEVLMADELLRALATK